MLKIGTHNSMTGEKGSIASKLLTPFARCQSKTLVEQYRAGCRLFDLRVKEHKGAYYGAHGIWRTKETVYQLLKKLYDVAIQDEDKVYFMTTYEGKLDEKCKEAFIEFWNSLRAYFPKFVWGSAYTKYDDNNLTVDWTMVKQGAFLPKNKQGFLPLDGHHWQTYFPVPWLWDKIYTRKHEFNEEIYIFVDFL